MRQLTSIKTRRLRTADAGLLEGCARLEAAHEAGNGPSDRRKQCPVLSAIAPTCTETAWDSLLALISRWGPALAAPAPLNVVVLVFCLCGAASCNRASVTNMSFTVLGDCCYSALEVHHAYVRSIDTSGVPS